MTDDSRSIELSIEVPGTPEEVWEAIATGPGFSSWFMPMQIDGTPGGAVRMDWGDLGTEIGRVIELDRPKRAVFEQSEWRGRTLAQEWTVEARDGGTCVVRLVNSGFGPDADWDNDIEGMTNGWKIFLQSLRLHLTHFRGRTALTSVPVAKLAGPNARAWDAFCAALGVPADMAAGDRIDATGPGTPELRAAVDSVTREDKVSAALLLLDGPIDGTGFIAVEGGGDEVVASLYLFLYGDGREERVAAWKEWFAATFPAPAPAAP